MEPRRLLTAEQMMRPRTFARCRSPRQSADQEVLAWTTVRACLPSAADVCRLGISHKLRHSEVANRAYADTTSDDPKLQQLKRRLTLLFDYPYPHEKVLVVLAQRLNEIDGPSGDVDPPPKIVRASRLQRDQLIVDVRHAVQRVEHAFRDVVHIEQPTMLVEIIEPKFNAYGNRIDLENTSEVTPNLSFVQESRRGTEGDRAPRNYESVFNGVNNAYHGAAPEIFRRSYSRPSVPR